MFTLLSPRQVWTHMVQLVVALAYHERIPSTAQCASYEGTYFVLYQRTRMQVALQGR